jgi:hypothetical protein
LALLKSEAAKGRKAARDAEDQPRLRLSDCRPNLLNLFKHVRRHWPLREVAERSLGRFAALVSAKLRR